ncbi:MAG: hypothetical protein LUQ65_04350 [Candidatus Helarchaeota archaeon]|nr:hypothetical protein [Candidatus Helarchaeota archaeon]
MLNVQFASEMDPNTDVTLVFIAADRILGMTTVFAERFFFDIGQMIQKAKGYRSNETLRSVKLPSGQQLDGQFGFIIAKSLKENLDFGILFNRLDSGGYHIIGLWPRDFAEICKTDHEIFEFLMYRLINTPDFFSKVTLYQSSEAKMPKMEVKAPTYEVKPPAGKPKAYAPPFTAPPSAPVYMPPAAQPTAAVAKPAPAPMRLPPAAEVRAAVKPAEVEITPTAAPPTAPPPEIERGEVAPEILEGRCPFCKANIPEPRLKVLERGQNTFCPKCLKILKGFKSAVPLKTAAPQESITDVTKRELADLVKQAEGNAQNKDYGQAITNYRKAMQKANLLDDKRYAKELEDRANACSASLDNVKIQETLKNADEFFRQRSYETAIKEYKIAIDIAKRVGNSEIQKDINVRIRKCAELIVTEKIEGLLKTGDTQLQEEKYAEAKQNYIQALELENRLGEKETIALLEQKIRDCDQIPLKKLLKESSLKAEKQFKVDKFDEAAQFYTEAASYASQLGDREAQRFFEQKVQECRTTPLRRQIQEITRNADSQLQSKNFAGALTAYKEAMTLAQQLGDRDIIKELDQKILSCGTGELDDKLQGVLREADNFFAQNNYAEAKRQYQSAVQTAKQLKRSDLVKSFETKIENCDRETAKTQIVNLLGQGKQFKNNQKFDDAIKVLNEAKSIALKFKETAPIPELDSLIKECTIIPWQNKIYESTNNAEIKFQSQNYDMAISLYTDVQKYAKNINDDATIRKADARIKEIQTQAAKSNLVELTSKGDMLLSERKLPDAKQKFEQAKQIAAKLNDTLKVQELDRKIAQCVAPAVPAAPSVPIARPMASVAPATAAPKPTPPPPAPKAAPGPKVEPTGFLCPFCDFPLPDKVVKELKKGFNADCPNCHKVLGKRALEV